MKYFSLSIKSKSLIFILVLISILLLTLYFQNKISNKNYLYLLQNNYKLSLDNYYYTFQENLHNKYQNIINTLDEKNINTKDLLFKLKKNSPYLKRIILTNTNTYKKFNIIKNNNKLLFTLQYKINNQIIEFFIDSRILLKSVKNYNQSDGIIYYENNFITSKEVFLNESIKNDTFSKLLVSCKNEKRDLINLDNKFYVTKTFDLNENIKTVFFLDVTKEKLEYISLVQNSLIVSILLFIFAAIIVNCFFNFLIKKITKNENLLKEINKNLEYTINKEIEHRLSIQKEKEKNQQMLIQQSKLAMMGEMIANIAHQWRQPLMQLSASIIYLDAYHEKGKLTKEKFEKKIKDSTLIIDFMSKTIEDFSNYFKPEKAKESFLLKEAIDSALFIIDSTLKSSNINIKIEYENENIKILAFKNEFSQALLNIISNAKDILILRNIINPQIHIKVYTKKSTHFISIKDNAKGIEEDIINKIFDPYFTTKHKSLGTGIGLYMSKMIIENNTKGKITVFNVKDGAEFIISLG